jgi:hypothetical protein
MKKLLPLFSQSGICFSGKGPVGRDIEANVAPKAGRRGNRDEEGKERALLQTVGHCEPNS